MIETTDDKFAVDVIEKSNEDIVLVDVWAPWCGPCKAQLPVLEQLTSDMGFWNYASVVKVNADENPETVRDLGVRSIPTLLWFVKGQEVHREVGIKNRKQLLDITNKFI